MTALTRRELAELLQGWQPGARIACPRCGGDLVVEPVNPSPHVAYVRRRAIVVCGRCGARGAADRPPPGNEGPP